MKNEKTPITETTETIYVTVENQDDFKHLVKARYISISENAKASFPALQTSGDIDISENAKTSFPVLQTSGYISIRENAKTSFPALQTSGYISISENAKTSFPVLQTSGYIYIYENAKASFPALQTSGYIYIYENAKASFPALQTSGYISIRENAKFEHKLTKKLNYKSVDNILFVIESSKVVQGITIHTGYNAVRIVNGLFEQSKCYVAGQGEYYAHGETAKKAIQDLRFKITAKKLKKDPIKEDTIITIQYYRIVTGACEFGVKSWIDSNFTDKEKTNILKNGISAKELLPILQKSNAYGFDKFKSLITF